MLPNFWKIQNRNVQTIGFVYHDTNGKSHGPVWKTQSFLLSEICTVILWQDCYGKGNLRKSCWSTIGRRFPIGNAYPCTVKKGCSYLCMWMTSNWLERKNIDPMWKVLNKEVDLGEPTSFLGSWKLGLHSTTIRNKQRDIVDNYRTMFESRISAGATEKLPCSEILCISSWSCDMEGHAKKYVETILWVGKQDDSTTLQSIYSVHRWPPLQRRRNEICRIIVTIMLSNCSKMFVLGTYWKTWYSVVSEKTCTIHYILDQSLWQTIMSFDILHSSQMWVHNNIVMWVILQNNVDWDCFKTFVLQEILRIQNLRQVEHCAFLEVVHLFPWVGLCKKQTSGSHRFNRIRHHFFGCRIEVGWYTRSRFMGSDCFSPWKHDHIHDRTVTPR